MHQLTRPLVALAAVMPLIFGACSRADNDDDDSSVNSAGGAGGGTSSSTAPCTPLGTAALLDGLGDSGGSSDGLGDGGGSSDGLGDGGGSSDGLGDGGSTDGTVPCGGGVDGGTPTDEEVPDLPPDDQIEDPLGNQMLVKLMVRGGLGGKNCVNWKMTSVVTSTAANSTFALVKAVRNEKRHADETKQTNPKTITSTYKTIGGFDGFKALARIGDTIKVTGTLSNCTNTASVPVTYTMKVGDPKRDRLNFANPVGTKGLKPAMIVKVKKLRAKKK